MEKRVITKWETEGGLAVIYEVDGLLLFYSTVNDPMFKKDEMLSMERADETKPYKAIRFDWDYVPSDAYISLTWSWK